jgi:hypothetical protein
MRNTNRFSFLQIPRDATCMNHEADQTSSEVQHE